MNRMLENVLNSELCSLCYDPEPYTLVAGAELHRQRPELDRGYGSLCKIARP